MSAFVFGPVPSRRLGSSLGIDTIPLKTCNWNCIYCQLGRTMPLTHNRLQYIPESLILDEVQKALQRHKPGEIDTVTFVGSGEPALHSGIGRLIRGVKQMTDLPLAVITNGALLYCPMVRQALKAADTVLPSLDAGTPDLYKLVNRPHPKATFQRLVAGLVAFRFEFSGNLWVEVMLMDGINDNEKALRDMAVILAQVMPDEIHINLPTRPPAETWVKPAGEKAINRALNIFSDVARVVQPAKGAFDLGGCDTLEEGILQIITRHPMEEDQLRQSIEMWAPGQVDQVLAQLKVSGQAQIVDRLGKRFWSAKQSQYPQPTKSQAAKRPFHFTN